MSLIKNNKLLCITVVWLVSFSSCKQDEIAIILPPAGLSLNGSIYYHIDLNDRFDDLFKITGYMDGLSSSNQIYQFPSVVPGTYSISDIGRFVFDFQVFDNEGKSISSEQTSINQWLISDPEDVYRIEYSISETWDTPVDSNALYRMGGTSLEIDHALINTFAVLGYPTGLKDREYFLELSYPQDWVIGTALVERDNDLFWASNYDYLVDSPILMGRLTSADIKVDQTEIGIYTYSKTDLISSEEIKQEITSVMYDASEFLKILPVDRYSFLFHFEDRLNGALEHSFSSVYALKESELTDGYKSLIKGISAHEFFHIVTPLNIHSEIISDFNFATPTPSAHLWLYEGVTEWASDMMQYRNGSINEDELFDELAQKYDTYNRFDKTISLEEISLKSYLEEGGSQFLNIYNKGALVAYMLDIRLLELSEGKFGLRELILELIEIYGPEKVFEDVTFFLTLEALTYPEIGDFIDAYITGVEELPTNEYFSKIGIEHDIENNTFTLNSFPSSDQQYLLNQWKVNL